MLTYDLCCGLGGWSEGAISEGSRVIGYDIEAHQYGDEKYPGELRLGSVLDIDGRDLADAGGSADAMAELNAARDAALKEITP